MNVLVYNQYEQPAALTCSTSVTRAPTPVEYTGNRSTGSRKRKANAATHRTKLCHTPADKTVFKVLQSFNSSAKTYLIYQDIQKEKAPNPGPFISIITT